MWLWPCSAPVRRRWTGCWRSAGRKGMSAREVGRTEQGPAMPPYQTKLGHTHLKVRDLKRSVDFYTRFFDLQVIEQVGGHYAFLSGGAVHHEIALQQVGAGAPLPTPHGVGLYHVAFEVPDRRAFALAYRALTEAGLPA